MQGRNHLFHLVEPSPWPLVSSIGAFFLTSGLVCYMHRILHGEFLFLLGIIVLALTIFF